MINEEYRFFRKILVHKNTLQNEMEYITIKIQNVDNRQNSIDEVNIMQNFLCHSQGHRISYKLKGAKEIYEMERLKLEVFETGVFLDH